MQDKKLSCRNCHNDFVWSREEQRLYAHRGVRVPEYCSICRGMMEARARDYNRSKYESNKS